MPLHLRQRRQTLLAAMVSLALEGPHRRERMGPMEEGPRSLLPWRRSTQTGANILVMTLEQRVSQTTL